MLPESIAGAAERFGDRDALVFAGRDPVTFGELHTLSDRAASALARDGVGEGSVAALMMPSGVEYVVAYLALAKLGAITAGVNTRMSADEKQRVLDRLQPDVVLESIPYAGGTPPTLDPNPAPLLPSSVATSFSIRGPACSPLYSSSSSPPSLSCRPS